MKPSHLAVALLLVLPLVQAVSPPSVPTYIQAVTGANAGEIALNWSAPASAGSSPVAGYNIYRSLSSAGLAYYTTVGNVLSFTDTGIPDGAPRHYRVSALNADGEGPITAAVNATAIAAPGAPRDPAWAYGGRGNITLSWQTPQYNGTLAILTYSIYRAPASTGPFSYLASNTTRVFNDTGLGDNASWYYRMTATNAQGEGPPSAVVAAKTPGVPDVVVNLTAGSFPLLGVQLEWEPPTDEGGSRVTAYRVYRAIGTQPEKIWTIQIESQANDNECPLLQTCAYRVIAVNAIGWSAYSDRVDASGTALPLIG
ncbi:MAG TPA: hypothetical protein VM370_05470 [Candidatus Thermoplasmatota archaeon]|nr:hypothetical protein [Candidatus Thermoplasmatota archaeon]